MKQLFNMAELLFFNICKNYTIDELSTSLMEAQLDAYYNLLKLFITGFISFTSNLLIN